MNRDQYLAWRNSRHVDYLYEYYTKNFDEKKHTPLLNQGEFFMAMQQWPFMQQAVQMVTEHYDSEFNVLMIPDKNNNPLRYE